MAFFTGGGRAHGSFTLVSFKTKLGANRQAEELNLSAGLGWNLALLELHGHNLWFVAAL